MAPPDWRSPWRPPPLALQLTLTSYLLLSVSALSPLATPFPKDLQPISVVTWEQSGHYPGFHGLVQDNDTFRLGLDFQRMLRINHVLYIAARDHVFAVNLTTASQHFVPHLKLTWKSTDVSKCRVRGKNSDECYNYVKVLVPRNDETLFACGTNAFNPTCRNYKMNTLEQVGEDVLGQARCPFESGQSNVGLFAGGDFYSATMTDFLASDAVIYRSLGDDRPVLRTVKYDSKWLREPHFLHAIDYGNYVYFFLREIAVEYTALGKVVFSRVARVCKNDNGGSPRVLEKYWTSFLKARLNCSIPGDSFFYFDVLQSLTNVLQINQRPAVVGLFTTQSNSIPGSAVCLYYMDDIEKVFNGRFKEQRTSDSSWTPVPEDQVPKPRPGCCAGDGAAAEYKSSVRFPDESLSFIKSFPLMDESVPSVNHTPCYTHTAHRVRLTQVAVDTSAGPFKDRTVLFLGSEDGRVQKVLIGSHPNDTAGPVLLEDITVYNPTLCNVAGQEDRSVMGLELDKEHHAVFVAFSGCVIRVPLSRCTQHGTCRMACLSSRDPYCVWLRSGGCANMASGLRTGFEQDIDGDQSLSSEACHDVMTTTHNHDNADSAYGVRGLADMELRWGSSVHYTLLIACVLVAFVLGSILSGLLVSCYCGRGSAHHRHRGGGVCVGAGPGKDDPEAGLPHALSLRSLAKLNGLAKEEKLDGSSSQMYSSFIPNLHNPTPSTPTPHHSLPLGDPDLSQGEGDVSGLPTPDSTPELPIKNNMRPSFRSQQWERNRNGNNAATETTTNPAAAGGSSAAAAGTGVLMGPPHTSGSGSGLMMGSSPGFMAIVGNSMSQQAVFPAFSSSSSSSQHRRLHGNLAGGVSSSSLHLPEERTANHEEQQRGAGPAPHHHLSQQSLPQAVVDVSALDELLQHIQEVSAAGNGGIRVLTSTSSVFPPANPSSSSSSGGGGGGGAYRHHAPPPHHRSHHYNPGGHHHHLGLQPRLLQKPHPLPQTAESSSSAPYFTSSALPMMDAAAAGTSSSFSSTSSSSSSNPASSSSNPTSSTSVPASSSSPCSSSTPLQRQVIPEFPGGNDSSTVAGGGGVASRGASSVARHHSQRHSLIKMGSGGGGAGGGGGGAAAVSRHHSFNQHPRGAPPPTATPSYFLARMNTNNSSSNAMAACAAASVTDNTTARTTASVTASMTARTTANTTDSMPANTTVSTTASTTANATATGLAAGGSIGVVPPHFLARVNTNTNGGSSSSNGPRTSTTVSTAVSSAASRLTAAAANGGSCQRPGVAAAASSCLTRQHSYSEPHAHAQRSAVVRRTASLKPQLPPKPLLLPPRPVLLPSRPVLLPSRPEPLPPCSPATSSSPSNQ